MPRRGNIAKRDVLPDPVYNDKVVTKLINQVMLDGKKGIAQGIVYEAFTQAAEKVGQDAKEMFNQALGNIMPMVEVKARRVGGANYQVPIEIRAERRHSQNGGSKQGVRSLQILIWEINYAERF